MSQTLILRFRDLVTANGETIYEHQRIINECGEVWWGWWMKQDETQPRAFLKKLAERIQSDRHICGFLVNASEHRFYEVCISKILAAPQESCISTPDPKKSPPYYHPGKYPAWFLLKTIKEVNFLDYNLTYDSFPTRPVLMEGMAQLVGLKVNSIDQLGHFNITLWAVREGF